MHDVRLLSVKHLHFTYVSFNLLEHVGARSGLGLALGLQAACNKRLGVRNIDDCHDNRDTKYHDSTIAEVCRDSRDTIQKGTNNCEIAAISIITLQDKLLSNLFLCSFHRLAPDYSVTSL